jgi:hypothetical protein
VQFGEFSKDLFSASRAFFFSLFYSIVWFCRFLPRHISIAKKPKMMNTGTRRKTKNVLHKTFDFFFGKHKFIYDLRLQWKKESFSKKLAKAKTKTRH